MASLSHEKDGSRTVQLVCKDRRRRSVRLGQVSEKVAQSIRRRIEHLDALSRLNQPLDAEAASWAAGIGDQLAEQLAKLGLLPARSTRRLREFLDAYIAGRANDGATKPTTMVTIRRVADDLVEAMGANRELRAVGAESAEQFKQR